MNMIRNLVTKTLGSLLYMSLTYLKLLLTNSKQHYLPQALWTVDKWNVMGDMKMYFCILKKTRIYYGSLQ